MNPLRLFQEWRERREIGRFLDTDPAHQALMQALQDGVPPSEAMGRAIVAMQHETENLDRLTAANRQREEDR